MGRKSLPSLGKATGCDDSVTVSACQSFAK
jgi:hypothetical protein